MSNPDRPRQIRRLAFELLFQLDAAGQASVDGAALDLAIGASETAGDLNEGGRGKARRMATEAWANRRSIDGLIARITPQWPAHRMPSTDRAVIRLAIHEMEGEGVSAGIAINEAVELARAYGTDKSAAFVNSVLDEAKAALRERGGEMAAPDTGGQTAAGAADGSAGGPAGGSAGGVPIRPGVESDLS